MDMSYYKKYEPIFGDWKIVREIGSGSFGKVFEIQWEDFGYTYKAALKAITIPQSQSELDSIIAEGMDSQSATSYYRGFVEELVEEFQLMSKLKGESNIVSYEAHKVIQHDDGIGWDILIRMELLTPLPKYVQSHRFEREDIARLGIDICKALELCRKHNIIHRDIKPDNIFVSDNGQFKLGDFGIAKTVEKTMSGLSKKGTYNYMAPEVYKGEEYGPSVDIYSLGIMLYRYLNNGRAPFLPPPPTPFGFNDVNAALARRMKGEPLPAPANADEHFAAVVLKACAYDPKERYASATEMREDLEAIMAGLSPVHAGDAFDKTVPMPKGGGMFAGGDETVPLPRSAPADDEAKKPAASPDIDETVPLFGRDAAAEDKTVPDEEPAAVSVNTPTENYESKPCEGTVFSPDETLADEGETVSILGAQNSINTYANHFTKTSAASASAKTTSTAKHAYEGGKNALSGKTILIILAAILAIIIGVAIFTSGHNTNAPNDRQDVGNIVNTNTEPVKEEPVITAVSAGQNHTVALKSDGTVAAVGSNIYGECNVEGWTDIVAISAGDFHTVGLRSDGTVVAVGDNGCNACNVNDWSDIVAISASADHTFGLKSDGAVVAVGFNDTQDCDVDSWSNIIAISTGGRHTVGLKKDGTVVAVGITEYGTPSKCKVGGWSNIIDISAGNNHTLGLEKDGTVVAVGDNDDGRCNVADWTNIIAVSAGGYHTIGLRANGTVVAVGDNGSGQCNVDDWTDIVAVSTGYRYTVGLKADGTLVAVGNNDCGQCNIDELI